MADSISSNNAIYRPHMMLTHDASLLNSYCSRKHAGGDKTDSKQPGQKAGRIYTWKSESCPCELIMPDTKMVLQPQ